MVGLPIHSRLICVPRLPNAYQVSRCSYSAIGAERRSRGGGPFVTLRLAGMAVLFLGMRSWPTVRALHGASRLDVRAAHKSPQVRAPAGSTTGNPRTKRDYAAHGGMVAIMAI